MARLAGIVWLLLTAFAFAAPDSGELRLVDGTRLTYTGLSSNPEGALILQAGQAKAELITWNRISPVGLDRQQREQQESFVRRYLAEARSLADASPSRSKQIVVGLNPLMALMDSQAQERLGWIDAQAFLAKKRPTAAAPAPKPLSPAPASVPDWVNALLLPDFSALPAPGEIAATTPERWQRFATSLRGHPRAFYTFVATLLIGSILLLAGSRLKPGPKDQLEKAQRKISHGVTAGILVAILLLGITMLTIFEKSPLGWPTGACNLLDIAVILGLAWGLTLRNPFAAVLLFLYFGFLVVRNVWAAPETMAANPISLGGAVLCLACFAGAIRGTLEFRRS